MNVAYHSHDRHNFRVETLVDGAWTLRSFHFFYFMGYREAKKYERWGQESRIVDIR